MTKGGSVPDAGSAPGGYGAPTPHFAQVSQDPYVAPEATEEPPNSYRQFPTKTPTALGYETDAGPGQFSGGENAASQGLSNAGDSAQFPVKAPAAFDAMDNGLGSATYKD
jgi:hypothetical protein